MGAGYGLVRGGVAAVEALGIGDGEWPETPPLDVFAAIPEGLLIWDAYEGLIADDEPLLSWTGYDVTHLTVTFWLAAALSLALSKYVTPALAAGVVVRWRTGALDRDLLPTRLRPRTAFLGLFLATALPAVVLAMAVLCLAAVVATTQSEVPFPHPLEMGPWLVCVAVSAGAVSLAAAMVPRQRFYTAFAAVGTVWLLEAVMGVAWFESLLLANDLQGTEILDPTTVRWLISAAFCALRLLLAYLALLLAARLWRRPPPST
jgi:hypothetical protein